MKALVLALSISRFEDVMSENNIKILSRKRSYKNRIYEIASDLRMFKKLMMDNGLEVGLEVGVKIL